MLTAKCVRENDVVVFEALPSIGMRKHCAGIISVSTSKLINAETFIDERYDYATIRMPLVSIEISVRRPFAVHIDRCTHEKFLAKCLEDDGKRVLVKSRVVNVKRVSKGYELLARVDGVAKRFIVDKLVLAEGFSQRFLRELGFQCVRETLVGAQVVVELGKRMREGSMSIVFDENLARNGFVWCASLSGGRKALVGIVAKPPIEKPLAALLTMAKELFDLDIVKVHDMFGGHVFAGYPVTVVRRNVVAVGDCVAMVKSVSGGGLYAISRVAPIVAYMLDGDEGKGVEELYRLCGELREYYILAKALHKALKLVPRRSEALSIEVTLDYLDYDRYLRALYAMMKTIGAEGVRIRWSAEVFTHEAKYVGESH